ncbi:MAG: DUF4271 domain-containing protein [Polaribacter sp.]|nr:DUF4271 domain-containing protein [Polaribacter sp.]
MQAIERMSLSNDWLTLILLFLFLSLFLLSIIDVDRFKEVASKLFKFSFLERRIDQNYSVFSGFHMLFTLFSVSVFSLLFFDIKVFYYGVDSFSFHEFTGVFWMVFIYFLVKIIIENVLIYLFMLRKQLVYFVLSKANYFFAISCYLFILILLKEYANLQSTVIYYIAGFLFFISFILHFLNNKNLIINHLFYFILYICTFEIAPLLILFKLMF